VSFGATIFTEADEKTKVRGDMRRATFDEVPEPPRRRRDPVKVAVNVTHAAGSERSSPGY
jgi:hypothetical protein